MPWQEKPRICSVKIFAMLLTTEIFQNGTMYIQAMTEDQEKILHEPWYYFKVSLQGDFPLIEVGDVELNEIRLIISLT